MVNQVNNNDSSSKPLVIEPLKGWIPIGWRDLYEYRELLYFLTWRDIKVKYKQTLLGASWAILQPLFMMVVFTLFFGNIAKVPSDNIPYPIFSYAGLSIWIYFSGSVSLSGNSLISGSNLISKIYFPRILMPASSTLSGILDYLISLSILVVMMVWYKITPNYSIILLPFLIAISFLTATGVGLWLSSLNVRYRDIRYVIPFLIQLWMFITPVIYPVSIVPNRFRWLLAFNPMTGIVEAHRACLMGHQPINWMSLGISLCISLIIFFFGLYYFKWMEKSFADVI